MVDTTVLNLSPRNSQELQQGLDQVGVGMPYSELHLSGTTLINSRLYFRDGTRITCEPNCLWKLMDNAPLSTFGLQIPIVGQKTRQITGIYVEGLTYDGNYKNQGYTTNDHGKGYGNFIGLTNCTNSTFSNIKVLNTEGDGFRINGNNLVFKNNVGRMFGHDFIHLKDCSAVQIVGNYVEARTNNAVRTRGCTNVEIKGNMFLGTSLSYAPLIQCENIDTGDVTSGIKISQNVLKNSLGPAIWLLANTPSLASAEKVTISKNIIKNCGLMPAANRLPGVGGVIFDGFTEIDVSKNVIDGCYGYGIGYATYLSPTTKTGMTAKIFNNIIVNTKASLYPGTESGTAVFLRNKTAYTVTSIGNCFYNNTGTYYNLSGQADIEKDPLFVDPDKDNYHLKSVAGHWTPAGYVKDDVTSPCIFPQGELGVYANTAQKSLCPTA